MRVTVAVASSGGGEAVRRVLRGAGADAVCVTLLRPEPGEAGALAAALAAAPQWLLLTSPQGARAALAVGIPPGVRLAALGSSTARVLHAAGHPPDFLPRRADAETLAAELPGPPAACLHPTTPEAGGELGAALRARGFGYTRVHAYRMVPRPLSEVERAALLGSDAVTAAAGSVARALAAAGAAGLPLAVIGPRTAAAAHEAGFARVAIAREPTARALAAAALTLWPQQTPRQGGSGAESGT